MVNVLIVEDDLSIADLLREALELEGYSICGMARTFAEAMASARRCNPDFAVIDVHLANGDLGTDVSARLRETTHAGIIFSTGNDHLEELTANDGDAVMMKPYRLRDMGRGLKIIGEIAQFGETELLFPRNFRLLDHTTALRVPSH